MRARRDQVQAYRFVTRRIVAAMLFGEPETTERPMRRLGLGVFASFMVTVLVMAGFGVWGLITGQNSDLEQDTLVFEEGTHGRYVYLAEDDRLHPVANIASAYLILGTAEPETTTLAPSELGGIERGPELGIAGAPDGLPMADQLADLPWRVCSVPPSGDAGEPRTTVVVGQDLPGGSEVGNSGLYVSAGDERYLVWEDRLLRIEHSVAPVVLGLSAAEPTRIGPQMINAITSGPDLDVVRPDGFDEESAYEVGGGQAYVGHIFFTAGQHYVMTHDGLQPLGELTVALRTGIGVAQIRDITGSEVSRHLYTNDPLEPEGYPLEVPEIHPAAGRSTTVCAVYQGTRDEGPAMTVEVFDDPPALLASPTAAVELRQGAEDDVAAADLMHIALGQGALVREASASGEAASGSTTYLVHPNGMRYAIANDALAALGYGGVEAVPVPANLLALIPRGPGMEATAAQTIVADDRAAAGG